MSDSTWELLENAFYVCMIEGIFVGLIAFALLAK
jgi:hypothetical protein